MVWYERVSAEARMQLRGYTELEWVAAFRAALQEATILGRSMIRDLDR